MFEYHCASSLGWAGADGKCARCHRPQPHSKPPLGEWTPGCLSFSRHHATVDGSVWLRVLKHISFLGNFLR